MTNINTTLFWSKVRRRAADKCWMWSGRIDRDGYGQYSRNLRAHRIAFILAYGPTTAVVRHLCDKPLCCNPAHMAEGSHADNVKDRVARNRSANSANGRWRGGKKTGQERVKPTPVQVKSRTNRLLFWQEKDKQIKALNELLAERVGFEPTVR
jgi:hypothetical protein